MISPELAVRFAVCVLATAVVVAVKFALVSPAGTVTDAGTVTAELLLERFTTSPPAGAPVLRFTVHRSEPAPMMVAWLQKSPASTAWIASPVPVRLMVVTPLPGASEAIEIDPVAVPAAEGSNFASRVTAFPGFSDTGKPGPAIEKPDPVTVAEVIERGAVPEEVSVTNCGVAWVLTVTSPKERVLALTLSPGVPVDCRGSRSSWKLTDVPLSDAVMVALWAALTDVTVAAKVALLSLAPTEILAGTLTAESLLERLTVAPLPPGADVNVTVQLSVADPVMVELLQETDDKAGGWDGGFSVRAMPVPLRGRVRLPTEELLATVRSPASAPAAVGAKLTLRVRLAPPARVMGRELCDARAKYWPDTPICEI